MAKMPGVARPWTNRHPMNDHRPFAVDANAVASASSQADATITRFSPATSEMRPTMGAANATASVGAVTVSDTVTCVASKTRMSIGSSGCVA